MSVPGGWVRLELEDLGQHSAVAAYPALRYSTVQCSTVSTVQYDTVHLPRPQPRGGGWARGGVREAALATTSLGGGGSGGARVGSSRGGGDHHYFTSFLFLVVFKNVINFSLNIS